MVELCTLRAERQAAFDKTLEEVQLLSQFAASKGEKYDVAANFRPDSSELILFFQSPQSPF
jgi:hypothetical protein